MEWDLVTRNLLNPPVLFFLLGALAAALKSDLEIPQPVPRCLSLYLLFAIGLKGGVELRASGMDAGLAWNLGAAVVLAAVVPVYCYAFLRLRLDAANAAAVAATYGSISAVTFITAESFLARLGVGYHGYMVAAMALMESPAILVGVVLARGAAGGRGESREGNGREGAPVWGVLLRDALLNGSVFLLLGSLVIGVVADPGAVGTVKPFSDGVFKGVLCLFLLDMGIVSARRLGQLARMGAFLGGFAVAAPLGNGALALGLAAALRMAPGDAFLLVTLAASASYIAVPAAMRHALPEANPSLYVSMALGVTFPFNVAVGLPLYYWAVGKVLGGT